MAKRLVVADRHVKLFVSGVAISAVELGRTHGPAVQSTLLQSLDQSLEAALDDDRYTLEGRRAVRSLYEVLNQIIARMPSLENWAHPA